LSRFLVVSSLVRVVVECVPGAFIDVDLVLDGTLPEGFFESRNPLVDPLVVAGIVEKQRRLDSRHVLDRRLASVVRNGGLQIRRVDRDLIGHSPSPAEACAPDLACR
jgi:hypothetical protein